jgi:hypothetical protein
LVEPDKAVVTSQLFPVEALQYSIHPNVRAINDRTRRMTSHDKDVRSGEQLIFVECKHVAAEYVFDLALDRHQPTDKPVWSARDGPGFDRCELGFHLLLFSLITLAMLSLTTVAALAPVLPSLAIRMLAMSLAFICIAALIGRVFFARLRQARFELPQERAGSEAAR